MRLCWPSLFFVLLLMACSGPENPHNGKSVFRYNESSGITSLDPAYSSNQANIWACKQLFSGLVQLDSQLTPQPCIASNWEISTDGLSYTFHLRTDVLFHQDAALKKGRKVQARDVRYSFLRICDEKTASPGAWVFNAVRRDDAGRVTGFEAPDDSTFIVRLRTPFPPMLGLLASSYCAVVPHEAVEAYGKDFRKHPVGTGPFLFHQWLERTALIFHKNPTYFERADNGGALPYLDAVMVSFISDKQTAFLEFLKGKLDMISGLDASYKDDLLTREGTLRPKYSQRFRMQTAPYLNTEYLGFLMDSSLEKMKDSPLNDVRVRKALNYGFDRVKMIRYLRNGMATPGIAGMIPPGIPGFDSLPVSGYYYRPELTAQLLEEAGYPMGKGLPVITMSTTHAYQDLCEYMQGQLAESGIRIQLEINQAAQHRQMVAKQQLPFFRGSWIGDYGDAENYLALFRSANKAPSGPNYTHYSSLEFDQLFDKAMSTTDPVERTAYYRQMDAMMMSDAPVIVLYYDKVLRLTQHNVEGLPMNSMNLLELKAVRLSGK